MSRIIGWGVWGILLSVAITFAPTIIAFVKKNDNDKQMLVYQAILFVLNLVICILLNLLPRFFVFNIIRNVWDIIVALVWIYMLICAIFDKKMPRP